MIPALSSKNASALIVCIKIQH